MSILKIVELPNKILRQKAKKVKVIDKKIKKLITDMQATLEAQADPEGVGLAAPQIGKSLRLFIVKYKDQRRVVINPKILSRSTPKKAAEVGKKHPLEGCLSLPHYYGPVKRPDKIKIKYQDEKGKKKTEEFSGFMACIISHEIDHLEGKFFVDHILSQKAPLYKYHPKKDSWEEVELI
jgi:peptide deformylase